jgi:hypothetical protein
LSIADHRSTVTGQVDREGPSVRVGPPGSDGVDERYDVVAYAVERRTTARRRLPVRVGFVAGVAVAIGGAIVTGEPVLGAAAIVLLIVGRAVALDRRVPEPYRIEHRAVPAGEGSTVAEAFEVGREGSRRLRRLALATAVLVPTLVALSSGRVVRAVVYLATVATAVSAPVDLLRTRPAPRLEASDRTEREIEREFDAVRWPDEDWEVSVAELE